MGLKAELSAHLRLSFEVSAELGISGAWLSATVTNLRLVRARWPRWQFDSDDSLREIIVGDLKAILLIVLTTLFLYLLPGSQLARARGTISQFFAGWASYIFAGAFAALFTTLFLSNPSLLGAFRTAGEGATYGLFVGWIIGLATLGGRRGTH